MAVTIRSGVVNKYRNIQLANFFVKRPELFRAEVRVCETAHELHRFETESFDRSLDFPARFLHIRQEYPSHTEILFRMSTLFQILRHRVVVCARQLATQITVPGVKQFAVLWYEHVNVESLPVHVLISSIEMPTPFGGLILDQGAVRQHRSHVVAVSDHPRRVWILSAHSLQKLDGKIMRVAVNVHFSALHRNYGSRIRRMKFRRQGKELLLCTRCHSGS